MSIQLRNFYAPAPRVERGMAIQLSAHPKKDKFCYSSGNFVVIRDLANPEQCDLYTEHQKQVGVAKYSPSGYYIASGDASGTVRIWDTVNAEHIAMRVCQPLSGQVIDLAWSPDNERLVVVGEGKEKFGTAILTKSGASIGDLTGHTQRLLSCDFRPVRPFRCVSGGEDRSTNFYEGPPFRLSVTNTDHDRYVNCVRYMPDGSHYIALGGDGKGVLYHGQTGAKVSELSTDGGHSGAIYSGSWSADGKQLLTCSSDKTAKLWDISTGSVVTTFTVSDNPTQEHMLLGTLWKHPYMIVAGLNQDLYYLDPSAPNRPTRVIQGHSKPISGLAVDHERKELYTTGGDGRCVNWSLDTHENVSFKNECGGISTTALVGDDLYTTHLDGSMRVQKASERSFSENKITLPGSASSITTAKDGTVFVSTRGGVSVIRDGQVVDTFKPDADVNVVALSPEGDELAVGCTDNKIYRYSNSDGKWVLKDKLVEHLCPVSSIVYSPDGSMVASGDTQKAVLLWKRSGEILNDTWVGYHSSRINALAWSSDNKRIASAGNDAVIHVWNVAKPLERVRVQTAHPRGVTGVVFLDDKTLVSTGNDACTKFWTLS